MALLVSKPLLVPVFKMPTRVMVYGYRHEADILGWTGIENQRVLVPPDPGPGSSFWSRALV